MKIADRALRIAKDGGGDQVVGVMASSRPVGRAGLAILLCDLPAAKTEGYIRLERSR